LTIWTAAGSTAPRRFRTAEIALFLFATPRPKAVLKPPHSKRCRDQPATLNLAKRLDCGVFTAAFRAVV
jgi:hypothetical protein